MNYLNGKDIINIYLWLSRVDKENLIKAEQRPIFDHLFSSFHQSCRNMLDNRIDGMGCLLFSGNQAVQLEQFLDAYVNRLHQELTESTLHKNIQNQLTDEIILVDSTRTKLKKLQEI